MAKSTGNITRVGRSPGRRRFAARPSLALISVHYRQALDFSDASLDAPRRRDRPARRAARRPGRLSRGRPGRRRAAGALDALRAAFEAALDDDLNVSAALAAVFDLVRELNRRSPPRSLSTSDAGRSSTRSATSMRCWRSCPTRVRRCRRAPRSCWRPESPLARRRDWTESDRLRDALAGLGIAVEDTRDGQRWRLMEPVA